MYNKPNSKCWIGCRNGQGNNGYWNRKKSKIPCNLKLAHFNNSSEF